MLSIEKLRTLLPNDKSYSDQEVEQIRDEFSRFAELLYDCWVEEKRRKKTI